MKKKFNWGLWIFLNSPQPIVWYCCYKLIFDGSQPSGSPFVGVVLFFVSLLTIASVTRYIVNPDEAVQRVFEDYRRWRGRR
jgi:hypothetical protein